jgi:P4 family phage/plasmid primase-like protien
MSDDMIRALADDAEVWSSEDEGRYGPPRQIFIGSDVEIAEDVAEDLRACLGQVIFCEGHLWHYDKSHWRAIDAAELRRVVHRYDGAVYGAKNNVVRLGKSRVDSVIHEMGAMLAKPDFFERAPVGINCATGFIRFATDGTPSLEAHNPEHRCRHVLQGKWDGRVTTEELAGFLMFSLLLEPLLRGVFEGDPDAKQKVALLQEVAGAAATGYGTQLRDPKAIILKGETAENGKSQILDLYRSLLPPDAVVSMPAGKMCEERYLPQLAGKLLNAADELSGANAIASDTFKEMITGEPVTGRDVYQSAVTFRAVAQHVFCTNTLPSFFGGMDRGVQRRLLVVQFNRVIPEDERIKHIGRRVGEEEPDLLLAWAVEGASRLIRQRGFTVPPSSEEALRHWLLGADPVLAWIKAGGVTVVDPNMPEWKTAIIKSKDAYSLFKKFAIDEGFRENTLPSGNGFSQRLKANRPTIQTKHTSTGNWLMGIRVAGLGSEADDDQFVRLSEDGDTGASPGSAYRGDVARSVH